jgi:hypothetical protein
MWLPWDIATGAAGVFAVSWFLLRRRGGVREAWVQLCGESALLLLIYAVWRHAGDYTLIGADGALERGRQIWRAERWLHLPNELTLQRWVLHATVLMKIANVYYIVCHVAPLGIFLVWLFVRHGDQFGRWRNQLAWVSLVCLAIQYLPVAPPRLLPDLGFIDGGAVIGPRVYDSSGAAAIGQLAAMPSMHVAWAMLIGIATWTVSRSRWRWIGPAHALMTVYAVTVTGYHWLADGIVATAVLLVGLATANVWQRSARRADQLPVAPTLATDVTAGSAAASRAPVPRE